MTQNNHSNEAYHRHCYCPSIWEGLCSILYQNTWTKAMQRVRVLSHLRHCSERRGCFPFDLVCLDTVWTERLHSDAGEKNNNKTTELRWPRRGGLDSLPFEPLCGLFLTRTRACSAHLCLDPTKYERVVTEPGPFSKSESAAETNGPDMFYLATGAKYGPIVSYQCVLLP